MRIVKKYGGTSVADVDRINEVARQVSLDVANGHQVVVVVSAMAGVTDQLASFASSMSEGQETEEYDVVVSTGEQVTSGLLAMALSNLNIPSRSFLGWQVPIRTDSSHGKARILSIDDSELNGCLEQGIVPVVPGFQGINSHGRITTLGRGGSDTSAVALAAALNADRCDICTDVEGVYTTDPRIVPQAKKLNKITYEEMLEMASLGAKVLQTRSVELAMKHHVRLMVMSSFSDLPGTLVCDEDEIVEKEIVSGIAYSRDEAKLTVVGVEDSPGVAALIFGSLADANINVDMIVQNISASNLTDVTFTVGRADIEKAQVVLEDNNSILCREVRTDMHMVKVSVIGVGMKSHVGVATTMFRTLAENGINIEVISTSEIKVSVLISETFTELALRSLHTAFGLDKASSQ
ncbi:MAG: aspartate kinase [Rhodospirillaceae bacterium]|nr:aspartate kinase [Rhodospirillaceae bacterium]